MFETQRIKIKRELLLLLGFPLTSYLTNSPQTPKAYTFLFFFMITCPLTKSFLSKMTYLVIDFFLEYSSFLLMLPLDVVL